MSSTIATSSPSLFPSKTTLKPAPIGNTPSPFLRFATLNPQPVPRIRIKASSSPTGNGANPIVQTLKSWARATILIGATATMVGKLSQFPARADAPVTVTEDITVREETVVLEKEREKVPTQDQEVQDQSSPLSEFLESNADAVEGLKSLLQLKLENFEDEEALKILKRLVSVQPEVTDWKFLMARLLNEMGEIQDARNVFEQILAENPLSFEALFENALLMDRSGEGEEVIKRLEDALNIAEEENKVKEAREVRLIMAQIQFLQKKVDEALSSYQKLVIEDPNDYRPYFCQGMIYSLLDKDAEANENFAKYRELSPNKFEVEGFVRSPLSRMNSN